jgi:ComF family protein
LGHLSIVTFLKDAFLKDVYLSIGDLLFPPTCIGCGELLTVRGGFACDLCRLEIEVINAPYCSICGCPLLTIDDGLPVCDGCVAKRPVFDVARSAFTYGGVALDAIKKFKYAGRAHLAGPLTAFAFSESVCFGRNGATGDINPADYDFLVPVPLYKKRLYDRGFNQALLISRKMKKRWSDDSLSINYTGLIRTRWTVPQTSLSIEERRVNVKGAFAVKGKAFYKKKVLLVDDVFTTGATVSECASVLKAAGAKKVGVFTLTRSVLK